MALSLLRFPAGIMTALLLAACQGGGAVPEEAGRDLSQVLAEADQAVLKGDFALADRLVEEGLAGAQAQGADDWTWRFRLVCSERRIRSEEFQEALEVLGGDVPETAGSSVRARVALNRARACLQLQSCSEAEAWLDQAERLAGSDDPGLPIDILIRKAQLKVGQGDNGKALELFRDAYRRAVEAGVPRLEVAAAGNLGWYFERVASRPDQAIPFYEKALEAAVQTGDKVSIVRAKTNLGWCHNKLGNFDRALEEMKSAIPLAVEAGVPDLDNTLAGIGGVYQYLDDCESALGYYHRALQLAADAAARADWSYNIAVCHISRGEWDLAEKYNRQAIANRDPDSPEELAYPQAASAQILMGQGRFDEAKAILSDLAKRAVSFSDPVPLWETYATLGRLAAERGDLQEADGMYQLALGRIEAARIKLRQTEEWQISFHSLWNHFAKSYVDLLVALGQSDRALQSAEANRALVLSEKLGVAAGRGSSAGFMEAARRLDATLLAYWLAPKRSFLWAVTDSGIRRVDLPAARDIENLVEGHQNRLLASQTAAARDPYAVKLYETLVAPVADLLRPGGRVVVVPDGRLHELNFETLQTPGERSRFLIEDVTIAVAPSLPLLQAEPRRAGSPKSLLLVGDPVAVDPAFPPLRGAKAEIEAVARHFTPREITKIVRENATPQAYMEASPGDYALIHFTAHAVANTGNPLSSAVILSPRDGAYRLFAREVEESRLRAAVVTLSACRSAGAKAYSGEGLVGFAWAFLQAGAQNVVAGLWDVDDHASVELMDVYYRQLALGRSPAGALREAKLDLMSKGTSYSKPYFWAPFQIYTRSSPFGAPPATLAFHH